MEDRYKDLFNDPNLGKEDWLEPGPELLSSIKAELYPKKKDRKALIIFFLLGVITILTVALFFTSKENNAIGELDNSNIESSLTSDNVDKSASANITQIATGQEEKNQEVEVKNINSNTIEKSTVVTKTKLNNRGFESTSLKGKNIQNFNEIPVLSSSKERLNFNTVATEGKSVIENNLLQEVINNKESIDLSIALLPFLDRIESTEFPISIIKKEMDQTPTSVDNLININNKKHNSWGINIGAGYFITRFILNSNYLAALEPAAFDQEPGSGQYIDLRIYKELNSRLSINISSNFGRTVFNSGHNSPVTYTLMDEESDQTIRYDMPMATPIGFISSEIVIGRAVDNVENETEIIVDLQNKHTLNMLDLSFGANYKLIDRKNLNLSTYTAYGFTYLLDVKNEFRSFTPSVEGFNSGNSRITSDQQNINNLTPVLDIGLDLNYEIRNGARVGLSYKFKTNLKPIFELDDFNSSMNRNQYGINFQFDLK